MAYVLQWLLMSLLTFTEAGHHPALRSPRRSDVLTETQDAISAVLAKTWSPSCTLIFIMDVISPTYTLYLVMRRLESVSNMVVFDTTSERNVNTTFQRHSWLHLSLSKVQRSTKCVTLTVVSDRQDFVTSFVSTFGLNEVLIWPARLLIVTRIHIKSLLHLKENLSVINGMVITLEELSHTKRCGIYTHLPYSYRLIHLASWTPINGLSLLTTHQLFPDKFMKLSDGADLTVAGEEYPPHLKVQEFPSAAANDAETLMSFEGPLIHLLDMLSTNINFTYKIVRPPDRSWGYLRPDGSWTGMVGMVVRKEIDFALGPFGITEARSKILDYSLPLVVDYVRITGKRGDTEVDPWGFALPLSPSVWSLTFASLLIAMIIATFFSAVRMDTYPSFTKTSFSYLRILLQQDIARIFPLDGWERIMMSTWLLMTLVLQKSYSGNLMSLLAVRYVPQPYQSLRAVVDDPRISMLWEANTAYVQYFTSVDSGIYYEMAEAGKRGRIKYITTSEYDTVMETLVGGGDHVIMIEDLSLKMMLAKDFTKKGSCEFYMSKERILPFTFCLVVQKNSPLREAINKGISAVSERGLYSQWMKDAVPNSTSCLNPPTKITVQASLSLANIWGMFVALAIGFIISILALIMEVGFAFIFKK